MTVFYCVLTLILIITGCDVMVTFTGQYEDCDDHLRK